eukprot:scaffold6648_cov63-Phaeocystis_antarctica.AAC.5
MAARSFIVKSASGVYSSSSPVSSGGVSRSLEPALWSASQPSRWCRLSVPSSKSICATLSTWVGSRKQVTYGTLGAEDRRG